MNIGAIFIWGLLQIVLMGTFLYMSFDAHVLSWLLSINVGVDLPGHTARIESASVDSAKQLSKVSSQFSFLPECTWTPIAPYSHQHSVLPGVLKFSLCFVFARLMGLTLFKFSAETTVRNNSKIILSRQWTLLIQSIPYFQNWQPCKWSFLISETSFVYTLNGGFYQVFSLKVIQFIKINWSARVPQLYIRMSLK